FSIGKTIQGEAERLQADHLPKDVRLATVLSPDEPEGALLAVEVMCPPGTGPEERLRLLTTVEARLMEAAEVTDVLTLAEDQDGAAGRLLFRAKDPAARQAVRQRLRDIPGLAFRVHDAADWHRPPERRTAVSLLVTGPE